MLLSMVCSRASDVSGASSSELKPWGTRGSRVHVEVVNENCSTKSVRAFGKEMERVLCAMRVRCKEHFQALTISLPGLHLGGRQGCSNGLWLVTGSNLEL